MSIALAWHGHPPDDYRIQVLAFANIETLSGAYFIHARSARMLWNYLQEVGPIGIRRRRESPGRVDWEQLTNPLSAMRDERGPFFGCFHERYSPLKLAEDRIRVVRRARVNKLVA
jgi:hypothetical protein